MESSKITAGRIDASEAMIVPVYDTTPLVGEEGFMVYAEGQMKYYSGGQWANVKERRLDGSTPEKAAVNGTELKNTLGGNAVNDSYYYRMDDGTTRQLWTDFTSYPPYVFVMSNRITATTQTQYLTTEDNVTDLALNPNDTTPTQNSKLSDAHMNHIIRAGTIRWNIAGAYGSFLKYDDDPQGEWYSNFGANQSCGYTTGFWDSYATPASSPIWKSTFANYQGACGAGQDDTGAWLVLSGIHTNDNTYFGGYTGASAYRATVNSPYITNGNTTNSQWDQPGYVLLSW